MTKSIILTIPEGQKKVRGAITPKCETMGLVDRDKSLLYGFHGRNSSKAPYLAAAFSRSNPSDFYVINLKLHSPEGVDESLMVGLLQEGMIDKVPFLVTKRIASGCLVELSEMWSRWAVDIYGNKTVLKADVDWTDINSFAPAFPRAIVHIFEEFPNLRCAIVPTYILSENNAKLLAWVGVVPKVKAKEWVSEANVSMKEIAVNLDFDN